MLSIIVPSSFALAPHLNLNNEHGTHWKLLSRQFPTFIGKIQVNVILYAAVVTFWSYWSSRVHHKFLSVTFIVYTMIYASNAQFKKEYLTHEISYCFRVHDKVSEMLQLKCRYSIMFSNVGDASLALIFYCRKKPHPSPVQCSLVNLATIWKL